MYKPKTILNLLIFFFLAGLPVWTAKVLFQPENYFPAVFVAFIWTIFLTIVSVNMDKEE